MCKEMPVIPVHRVLELKRITGKNGGPGGERHKGLLTKKQKKTVRRIVQYEYVD
jgi:hypothetical protein